MDENGLTLGIVFGIGMGLGFLFFGGLWLTVKRIPTASHPTLLVLGSFWGRAAVCMAGFYLVMDGHGARLASCVLGFFVMRFVMIRYRRPQRQPLCTSGASATQGDPL